MCFMRLRRNFCTTANRSGVKTTPLIRIWVLATTRYRNVPTNFQRQRMTQKTSHNAHINNLLTLMYTKLRTKVCFKSNKTARKINKVWKNIRSNTESYFLRKTFL